jgi:hypothetical protein
MKKIIGSLLLACILSGSVVAQKAAKAVYAEIGGPGLASINYDMRFQKKEGGLGFRVGAGGLAIDGTSLLLVPAGLNYIVSKDQKNYFEVGAGITYVRAHDDYDDFDDDFFDGTFGHLSIGYRLQPAAGGFFFRAAITPVFGSGTFFPYYAGIGFGYKF